MYSRAQGGVGTDDRPCTAENAEKKPRAIGYARVSTKGQEEDGASLDAQREGFAAFAQKNGLELLEVVSDAQSGKNTEREGLQRALRMLRDGQADALIVAKLDRLTRSVRDWGELVEEYFEERFKLHTQDDQLDLKRASGRLFANIKAAFAQYERELGAERTRDTLRSLRSKGKGTPQVAADTIARILELHAAGLSLRAICTQLVEEGYPTLKGGKWQASTIRKVLARTSTDVST